jgi:hypothetical protein
MSTELNLKMLDEVNVPEVTFFEDNLSSNKNQLYETLRNELIKARLEANDYSYTENASSFTVEYSPSNENPTEDDSLYKFRTLCEKEAAIIAKAVFQYITAAQLGLRVLVPHFEAETPTSAPQHSTLGTTFFPILGGGGSTPRGLKIE